MSDINSEDTRSEAINAGTRFRDWCVAMGRTKPPDDVIDALNRSIDEGTTVIKRLIPTDATVWQDYQTFLSGVGRNRV